MKTLIKNAVVVLPEGSVETSVLIDGTKIAAMDGWLQDQSSGLSRVRRTAYLRILIHLFLQRLTQNSL